MTSTPSAVPKHLNFITGNKNKLAEVRVSKNPKRFPLQVNDIAGLWWCFLDDIAWLHLLHGDLTTRRPWAIMSGPQHPKDSFYIYCIPSNRRARRLQPND
jgi:hypothetical protein